MKSSTKRISSILTAILMIIASLFIYSSSIRPVYSEIKNLRSEIAGRLDLINRNKASIEQVQKLLSEYESISQAQEVTSLVLSSEQNISQAVNQIVSLIDLNDLSIELLAVQQLAIKPSTQPNLIKGVGILRFNLRLAGSYGNFKTFLQNLETNINLMDLASLRIEPGGKTKTGGDNLSYAVIVDSYYQAQ